MQELLEHADLIVEAFGCLTAALIAAGSLYAYSKTHKPRHAAFGFAFFLIAIGLLLSTVFNWVVELELVAIPFRGYMSLSYELDAILLLSMLSVLIGFVTLLLVNEQITNPKIIALVYILTPFVVWTAHEFYVSYHLVLLAIVALICAHYVHVHVTDPGKHSLSIASAFGILLLSQIVFLFSIISPYFYIAGHALRFVSFVVLFFTLVSIYRSSRLPRRKAA